MYAIIIAILNLSIQAPPPPPAQPQQTEAPAAQNEEGAQEPEEGSNKNILTNKEKEDRAGYCTEFAKIELSPTDQAYAGIDAKETELVRKAGILGIYPTNIVTWFMNADAAEFFKKAPTYILNIISRLVQQTQPTPKNRSKEHILFKGNAVDAFKQIANSGKKLNDDEEEESPEEEQPEGETPQEAQQPPAQTPPPAAAEGA